MARAHGSRKHYVQLFRYPCRGAPRFERGARTVEVEPPYRTGTGVSLRLGLRRAIILGRWGVETQTEAEALYMALAASDMDVSVEEIVVWG